MNIKPGLLVRGSNLNKEMVGIVVDSRVSSIDNKEWSVFTVRFQRSDNTLAIYAGCESGAHYVSGYKEAPTEISLVRG